ncbi:MAG: outer membrane protein assembly factor BamE [Klebsiella michiganensis]|nr:outer membrane protein assembly factor BamE [Klebsiella michiganensis]
MRCKMLTAAAAVLLMLTAGCSTLERVVYRPDINQGNYLTNTWFYVFRQQPGHEKVTQQTLTLTFNSSGVLTNIDNKPALTAE